MKKPLPIVLDTDPGVDDFFCLAMLCAFPEEFSLRAVTTIGGNNSTEVTTKNALDILALFGKDAPVYPGADHFTEEEFGEPVVFAHGHNGLADVTLRASKREPEKEKAWDALYQIAKEENGELVVVTVGPQTNLALALLKYPSLKTKIRKIVMMGGTLGTGNISPYAEANVGNDAIASRVIFESGIPVDMIGLDTTRQCKVSLEEFEEMSEKTDPLIREIMRRMITFRKGEAMHDAAAFSTLLDPEIVSWKTGTIHVETETPLKKGRTTICETPQGIHRAAYEPRRERYKEVFGRMLERYPVK